MGGGGKDGGGSVQIRESRVRSAVLTHGDSSKTKIEGCDSEFTRRDSRGIGLTVDHELHVQWGVRLSTEAKLPLRHGSGSESPVDAVRSLGESP